MPQNIRGNAGMSAALTCADVRAREWDFVEGALPIPERAAVQTHLDGCESCGKAMTLCQSMEDVLLSASAHIPAAGDLRAGFYARLATQQRPAHRYGRPMIALSTLAVGIMAVALIRPAIHTSSVSPSRNDNTVAMPFGFTPLVAATPPSHSDNAERPRLLDNGFGVTGAQMDRLFASEPVKVITPRLHRRTFHRSISITAVASVDRPTVFKRSLNRAFPESKTMFRETAPMFDRKDSVAAAPPTFAFGKEEVANRDADPIILSMERPSMAASSSADRMRAPKMQVKSGASTMPLQDGVSFDVIDQDRGFSNSTRIASDVEVQGEDRTVHIEADGN